ncbi:MAG: helix-turn-helix transcriptional regulator [Enhydrobacter sp.]|nr:helix-turn-helix transcriptional regulator [Enhydrobacter sp.]
MSTAADPARKALSRFLTTHKISQRRLCKAAGLSPSAINQFLLGNAESPKADTYEKIAKGAGEILGRAVSVAELRGTKTVAVDIPVRSYVGAGDEIFVIPEDEQPIDWVEAPPGMEDAEATMVRGRSGLPLYHDGDVLYHRRVVTDPGLFRGEIVVAQVKNGKRYVKLLERGQRRSRYNLVSINPAFPPLEDQQLEWIGPIEWVKKTRRRF